MHFLYILLVSFVLWFSFYCTFDPDLFIETIINKEKWKIFTSLSSSVRDGSSSSGILLSGLSGSLDSSTCSSTFSCLVRRAISCDFKPLELKARQSSSLRKSFTCQVGTQMYSFPDALSLFYVQAARFAEPYFHWFRVKFSPVRWSTNVLWFPIVLLFFLLDKKSLRQRDRQRERNGRGKSEPNTRHPSELKQLIRAWSKATSFSHCLVLVSSRLCLSPLLLKHTQGSSLALIKTNRNAPQLPINQSVEHKKGKINEWCVVTVNWSWSPNGVWIGWPYYDLWLNNWI